MAEQIVITNYSWTPLQQTKLAALLTTIVSRIIVQLTMSLLEQFQDNLRIRRFTKLVFWLNDMFWIVAPYSADLRCDINGCFHFPCHVSRAWPRGSEESVGSVEIHQSWDGARPPTRGGFTLLSSEMRTGADINIIVFIIAYNKSHRLLTDPRHYRQTPIWWVLFHFSHRQPAAGSPGSPPFMPSGYMTRQKTQWTLSLVFKQDLPDVWM